MIQIINTITGETIAISGDDAANILLSLTAYSIDQDNKNHKATGASIWGTYEATRKTLKPEWYRNPEWQRNG